jgi:flagellar basal-body rod protein FlgB
MDFLTNNSFRMMEKSMDFLWAKQAAILDNIANAETPNYKAKVVRFEDSLKEKLERARASATPKASVREVLEDAQFAVTEQQESTRMDDNGVNVTEQSAEMIRNAYQLQYVMNAISSDLNTLRTAVRGQ